MLAIALLYWLLCARVRMRVSIVIHGSGGSFSLEITSCFVHMQWNGMLAWMIIDKPPYLSIRFGKKSILPWGRLRRREKRHNQAKWAALRAFRVESVQVFACVGMGDAAATAVTSAALQAVLSAMAAVWRVPVCCVYVDAKLNEVCFASNARCIFSASLGDIMFAAAKAAAKKYIIRKGKRDPVGKASH